MLALSVPNSAPQPWPGVHPSFRELLTRRQRERPGTLLDLAVAYAVSGESKYIECIQRQIDGWISQNPFGLGVHWCSSLEVSLRIIAWSFVHSLVSLRDKDGLFGKLKHPEEFAVSIYQHAYFIANYLSRYSSANNHLIGELTGLWVVCKVFDLGDEGGKWSSLAKTELIKESTKQVFKDGVSKEQASYYHLWVADYLLLVWLIGQHYGDSFDDAFRERITLMCQFLMDIKPSGGLVPQIGDSDDGHVVVFNPLNDSDPYEEFIKSVTSLSDSEHSSPDDRSDKAFWYKQILGEAPGDISNLLKPRKNHLSVSEYRHGGYTILRDDYAHVVFDSGTLGYPSIAAHGHADALSFCMAVKGFWCLVDTGTYCYHTEQDWRNYFRGTSSHNTVVINGKNQSLIGGAFLWLKHSKVSAHDIHYDKDTAVEIGGSVVGYSNGDNAHQRKLTFNSQNKHMTIVDTVKGKAADNFEVMFHFHPQIKVKRVDKDVFQVWHEEIGNLLKMKLDARLDWRVANGELNPHLGWYSETLGVKVPCNVIVGKASIAKTNTSTVTIDWSQAE